MEFNSALEFKISSQQNKNIPKFYQKNVATSLLIATKYLTSF